ncbi:restriction endonuclease subunit S [Variovorax sp. CY25R-8]|uniref:restriction endonuclease subunit S n=1 Tax=Variovorax sp. CY25R-8 TaxID=2855501 RepID=UPI0021BB9B6A|nr:restriction endonuclease subunit S [Variovorax sp. CY25R-8]MCT8177028.1 restriction endonuclease subunit S [Variovorax sp. CY25R-8]
MSLPRYGQYKNSGLPWVGSIPLHWDVYPLKRELTFLTSGSRGWAEHYSDDGALFIRIGNLTRDSIKLDLSDIQRVEIPSGAEGERTKVQPGDVLFSITAYLGSVAVVPDCLERAFVSQHVALARLRAGKVLPSWVAYVAASELGKTYLETRGYGGTKVQLSLDDVAGLLLPVPTTAEQSAIVAFLDGETSKIDALIAEQVKLIALLAEKRQATISRAVTKGLNPSAPMKDSGVAWMREVPAHWDVVPLKYLVELRSGGTPSKDRLDYWDGDIPWASAKDLKVEKLGGTIDRITQQAVEDGAASLVRAGAVLVVVRGMILARMFPVVETLVPMTINQDLKAVLPRNGLNASFLAWLLRGSADESLQRLDEAGHGTKALRMDAWTSMQLPIPPLEEQVQLIEFISRETAKLDALRTESEQAIGLLNERRRALIASAVTGQIDVRNV